MNNEYEKESRPNADFSAEAATVALRDEFLTTMRASGDATAKPSQPNDSKDSRDSNSFPPTDTAPGKWPQDPIDIPGKLPQILLKDNASKSPAKTMSLDIVSTERPPAESAPSNIPPDALSSEQRKEVAVPSNIPAGALSTENNLAEPRPTTAEPMEPVNPDPRISDLRKFIEREEKLSTGDTLVENVLTGERTIKTESGDKIKIDRDGKVTVDGKVTGVSVDRDGRQTYTMADGAVIVVSKTGIESITRNNHTVSFSRIKPASFKVADKR